MLQVDRAACTGCGVCVASCPQGAICMVDEKAEIALRLCTSCGACAEVCPVGALVLVEDVRPPAHPVHEPLALAAPSKLPAISSKPKVSWAGLALGFADRWLIPRVVDELIAALDRRLSTRTSPAITPAPLRGSPNRTGVGQGYRRRRRRRGG